MKKCIFPLAVLLFIAASTTATAQNWVQSGNTAMDLSRFKQPDSTKTTQNSQSRGEILVNAGFETGSLTPWITYNWKVTTTAPHGGNYCATVEGNYFIRQEFPPIPVDMIKSITLWSRQPEEAIQGVDMYYLDGTWDTNIIFPKKDWQNFDVTSFLPPGQVLVALVVWGYSGGGPDPDISYIDDVSIIIDDLLCDSYSLSEKGGKVNFFLNAGVNNASRNYLLLGSISGTSPGIPLPGGMATLPLNWDIFTNAVLLYVNTPVFDKFLGGLDAGGKAVATLTLGPIPGTAGLSMHFAYLLNNPFNYVSTPVNIVVVP
jgi:hypothetical protein